ncbi:CesT family type III secretion system chaperone [Pleurocapsa sp. FMAR1]|uniref:CesT family type III secretion system chaperone n=1 Tax=Pleurocapsa sp. FMAR1 TaxID=3040204 RepID=UPI0029C83AFD|nr:CesT family type III secretion system chaperone [Pleurocapsa sp. FMAR1]
MKAAEISTVLEQLFDQNDIKHDVNEAWQIKNSQIHLLVILSEDSSWLRLLTPIATASEAQSLLPQLLEDNFDLTQEVRYAINQNVLWGVYQHRLESLTAEDLKSAIASLQNLIAKGLSGSFNQLIEKQIIQIVKAAKAQGQTLEATYQTIDRFYQEGVMGGIDQDPNQREQFLAAWKSQLERLWSEVEV